MLCLAPVFNDFSASRALISSVSRRAWQEIPAEGAGTTAGGGSGGGGGGGPEPREGTACSCFESALKRARASSRV